MGFLKTISNLIHNLIERMRRYMETDDQKTPPSGSSSDKFNKLIGRVAAFSITVVVAIAGMIYKDTSNRVANVEERVNYLFMDKISRAEFKEEINQLRVQNEANKADILSRQNSVREDIIARLDMYMQIRGENQVRK